MTQGAHDATNSIDNPFWRYSLTTYQKDYCADFLLHAQNTFGMNVNILLFCGWLAQNHTQFAINHSFMKNEAHFQVHITQRIRNLRIRSKLLNNQKFYEELKQLELLAEFIEQKRLYTLSATFNKNALEFEDNVRQGIDAYWTYLEIDFPEQKAKSWMQTLIQYLHPAF